MLKLTAQDGTPLLRGPRHPHSKTHTPLLVERGKEPEEGRKDDEDEFFSSVSRATATRKSGRKRSSLSPNPSSSVVATKKMKSASENSTISNEDGGEEVRELSGSLQQRLFLRQQLLQSARGLERDRRTPLATLRERQKDEEEALKHQKDANPDKKTSESEKQKKSYIEDEDDDYFFG